MQESDVKIADSNKFLIDNNINIDYQKYDAIIKKIISTYDLNNVNCKTVITMYIDILDENDKIKNTSSMSVNIPLNVKTVNVEVENNIDSSEEKIFIESQTVKSSWIILIISIILIILEILNIRNIINDIKNNCPKEIIEKIKLKRILREYHSYIQKINSGFDLSKYDMIKVEKFEDLLRIREIIQNPILMIENETQTKTYFVVTTSTSMLYSYEINHGGVKEISD